MTVITLQWFQAVLNELFGAARELVVYPVIVVEVRGADHVGEKRFNRVPALHWLFGDVPS